MNINLAKLKKNKSMLFKDIIYKENMLLISFWPWNFW